MFSKNKDLILLAQDLSKINIIAGNEVVSDSKSKYPLIYPATNEIIGEYEEVSFEQVDQALKFAKNSFEEWKQLTPQQRAEKLMECIQKLEENKDVLSSLLVLESGKAIRTEARPEVSLFINVLKYFAGLSPEIKGQTIPFSSNTLNFTIREPVGVVTCILPWNVPLVLMAYKIFPALICGNTVVVKPSEDASLSAMHACRIIAQYLPKGVLSALQGRGESVGNYLTSHPDVNIVSFTGSAETGKKVYQNAARSLKKVFLELGGKSPMIIFPDAKLEDVIDGVIKGMRFTRMGQSCCAMSRIYVHKSLFEPFMEGLTNLLNTYRIGDPFNESTDIGSIANLKQYKKTLRFLEKGMGYKTLVCGTLPTKIPFCNGFFVNPTFYYDLPHDNIIIKEEIFGPIATIHLWEDEEEVLKLANDTNYGLSASLWTKDIEKILYFSRKLEAGYIQVNGIQGVMPNLSFGGFKGSGIGKEATLEAMLDTYTQSKTVLITMTK